VSLLDVEGLSYGYPEERDGGPGFTLEGVSFSVREGEAVGVLGPNGSGKSTLLRLIGRAIRPRGGRILLAGRPMEALSGFEVARELALVPQEMSTVFAVTVRQMVALGLFPRSSWFGWRSPAAEGDVDRALRQTDLWDMRERFTTQLSGGERRRVLLARALAQRPRLLLLDEPTAHLDPRHQMDFVSLVEKLRKEEGLGVVTVLHDLNLALAWCSRLIFLKDGRVKAQGDPLRAADRALLQEVYGLPLDVKRGEGAAYVDFFHSMRSQGDLP
jgi:iron complex transport system ATP-binding protein